GDWATGWGRIADLGDGDWKAPDLQDVFLRMAGTDRDTANPAPVGFYQADALQNITGQVAGGDAIFDQAATSGAFNVLASGDTGGLSGQPGGRFATFDASRVARTSTETRGA